MTQQGKKKILFFLPSGVGGAERMSVLIGKMLPKDRYYVKYVVIGRQHKIYDILPKQYDVDCIPLHNIYAFSTLRIWWKIIREKPDFVFASQVAYNPRIIIAAKMACRRVIIRSSGMLGNYPPLKLKRVQLTYPKADRLIAQQEEMRKEMIQLLNVNPNKVIAIHNPIDTTDIDELSKDPSPYPTNNCINFVQTASVNHRKAQDIAIQAFAIVNKEIPNSELYFVGNYDERSDYFQRLQQLADELKVTKHIHFIGYDKNPFRWVKNSDCFVFPSRAEGLPNALIEASYLGVPCVATRCLTIVDEIIKDGQNGCVVNVDDVEAFAKAMLKAVKLKNCKMIYKPGTTEDFARLFEDINDNQNQSI